MNAAAAGPYQAGLQAFQAGDLQGARSQFARAAQSDANAYQAHYSMGVIEERLGRASAAASEYRAALSIVHNYEPAIYALGVLQAVTGNATEAESFLNRYRSSMPQSAAVLAALAEVKSIEHDSQAAQQLAQEALKKNPDYRPAMLTLARDHYRNRRLDLALYTLTAILEGYGPENPPRDKNNGAAILLRALIYEEQGRRRDALADFRRAVDLRPDLVEARVHLARYMLEAGNAVEAAPILETALRYDVNNLPAHLNLGDAYRLLGRTDDARRNLEWVLQKDSSVAEANYNLGLLYLFSANLPNMTPVAATEKAIAYFQKYKEMRPHARPGAGDDVDELITRAKNKKAVLEAEKNAPPPPPPAPAAAGGNKPAAPPNAPSGSTASFAGASPAPPPGAQPAPSQPPPSQPPPSQARPGAPAPSGGPQPTSPSSRGSFAP